MSIVGKSGRPPGLPKSGGRKKGTPNRATFEVAEILAKAGCDPIEALANIGMDKSNPLEIRVRVLTGLAEYRYPKRKAADGYCAAILPQVSVETVCETEGETQSEHPKEEDDDDQE